MRGSGRTWYEPARQDTKRPNREAPRHGTPAASASSQHAALSAPPGYSGSSQGGLDLSLDSIISQRIGVSLLSGGEPPGQADPVLPEQEQLQAGKREQHLQPSRLKKRKPEEEEERKQHRMRQQQHQLHWNVDDPTPRREAPFKRPEAISWMPGQSHLASAEDRTGSLSQLGATPTPGPSSQSVRVSIQSTGPPPGAHPLQWTLVTHALSVLQDLAPSAYQACTFCIHTQAKRASPSSALALLSSQLPSSDVRMLPKSSRTLGMKFVDMFVKESTLVHNLTITKFYKSLEARASEATKLMEKVKHMELEESMQVSHIQSLEAEVARIYPLEEELARVRSQLASSPGLAGASGHEEASTAAEKRVLDEGGKGGQEEDPKRKAEMNELVAALDEARSSIATLEEAKTKEASQAAALKKQLEGVNAELEEASALLGDQQKELAAGSQSIKEAVRSEKAAMEKLFNQQKATEEMKTRHAEEMRQLENNRACVEKTLEEAMKTNSLHKKEMRRLENDRLAATKGLLEVRKQLRSKTESAMSLNSTVLDQAKQIAELESRLQVVIRELSLQKKKESEISDSLVSSAQVIQELRGKLVSAYEAVKTQEAEAATALETAREAVRAEARNQKSKILEKQEELEQKWQEELARRLADAEQQREQEMAAWREKEMQKMEEERAQRLEAERVAQQQRDVDQERLRQDQKRDTAERQTGTTTPSTKSTVPRIYLNNLKKKLEAAEQRCGYLEAQLVIAQGRIEQLSAELKRRAVTPVVEAPSQKAGDPDPAMETAEGSFLCEGVAEAIVEAPEAPDSEKEESSPSQRTRLAGSKRRSSTALADDDSGSRSKKARTLSLDRAERSGTAVSPEATLSQLDASSTPRRKLRRRKPIVTQKRLGMSPAQSSPSSSRASAKGTTVPQETKEAKAIKEPKQTEEPKEPERKKEIEAMREKAKLEQLAREESTRQRLLRAQQQRARLQKAEERRRAMLKAKLTEKDTMSLKKVHQRKAKWEQLRKLKERKEMVMSSLGTEEKDPSEESNTSSMGLLSGTAEETPPNLEGASSPLIVPLAEADVFEALVPSILSPSHSAPQDDSVADMILAAVGDPPVPGNSESSEAAERAPIEQNEENIPGAQPSVVPVTALPSQTPGAAQSSETPDTAQASETPAVAEGPVSTASETSVQDTVMEDVLESSESSAQDASGDGDQEMTEATPAPTSAPTSAPESTKDSPSVQKKKKRKRRKKKKSSLTGPVLFGPGGTILGGDLSLTAVSSAAPEEKVTEAAKDQGEIVESAAGDVGTPKQQTEVSESGVEEQDVEKAPQLVVGVAGSDAAPAEKEPGEVAEDREEGEVSEQKELRETTEEGEVREAGEIIEREPGEVAEEREPGEISENQKGSHPASIPEEPIDKEVSDHSPKEDKAVSGEYEGHADIAAAFERQGQRQKQLKKELEGLALKEQEILASSGRSYDDTESPQVEEATLPEGLLTAQPTQPEEKETSAAGASEDHDSDTLPEHASETDTPMEEADGAAGMEATHSEYADSAQQPESDPAPAHDFNL